MTFESEPEPRVASAIASCTDSVTSQPASCAPPAHRRSLTAIPIPDPEFVRNPADTEAHLETEKPHGGRTGVPPSPSPSPLPISLHFEVPSTQVTSEPPRILSPHHTTELAVAKCAGSMPSISRCSLVELRPHWSLLGPQDLLEPLYSTQSGVPRGAGERTDTGGALPSLRVAAHTDPKQRCRGFSTRDAYIQVRFTAVDARGFVSRCPGLHVAMPRRRSPRYSMLGCTVIVTVHPDDPEYRPAD